MTAHLVLAPGVPASLNRSLRAHWGARLRANTETSLDVFNALLIWERANARDLRDALRHPRKHRVEFVRVARRNLDSDNLAGSLKAHRDALVRLGVLYDDSPDWIEATYTQRRPATREPEHVEINIAEIEESER